LIHNQRRDPVGISPVDLPGKQDKFFQIFFGFYGHNLNVVAHFGSLLFLLFCRHGMMDGQWDVRLAGIMQPERAAEQRWAKQYLPEDESISAYSSTGSIPQYISKY
jgi:hypothetical protein